MTRSNRARTEGQQSRDQPSIIVYGVPETPCYGSTQMTKRSVSRRSWSCVRFSLRSLLVLVLLIGAALGWMIRNAREQRLAVAAIEKSGGWVWYDWQVKDVKSEYILKDAKPRAGVDRGSRWFRLLRQRTSG